MVAPQADWYRWRVPTIAQNLKRLRKKAGLSQTRLAELARVSQQLISQLERGENEKTKELPNIARALGSQVHEIDEDYREGTAALIPVPLLSWVNAGILLEPDPPPLDLEEIPILMESDLDPSGDWFALRVDGDSMNKVSPHNSIIFINRKDRRPVRGGLYVITDGEGGATYKQFEPPNIWKPVSTNPHYEVLVPKPGTALEVIGRVRKSTLKF